MYGTAAVDSWINARNELMDTVTLPVFNNEFIARCGLDRLHGAIV
jgi:hypothetical protein